MHWSERVAKILNSQSGNLIELARVAGLDPQNLYAHQDLSGCDLRGQDLRGLNLEGCNIDRALIDPATKIDSQFDPRFEFDYDDYIYFSISREMNTAVLNFMGETGYTYAAWAHKNLFERGMRQIRLGRWDFYRNAINGNRFLLSALKSPNSQGVTIRILRYKHGIEELRDIFVSSPTEPQLREIILIGLISRKIKHNDRRDFSKIPMNVFYPPKLIKVEGSIPTLGEEH